VPAFMVSLSFPSNKTNVVPLCVVAVADFSRKKKKEKKRKKKKEKKRKKKKEKRKSLYLVRENTRERIGFFQTIYNVVLHYLFIYTDRVEFIIGLI
jgi:DNA invertase Pin-like site-specific DNA recombinase